MTTALNVLGFSTSDSEGGSARSARRIHHGLRRLGHRSRLLVGRRQAEEPDADVDTTHGGGVRRLADRVAEEATRRLGLQYQYYPSSRRVLAHPWVHRADVFQLYNTHGGYLSHRLIPRLAARAPVVWRFSDMWPMTGHCGYAGECARWQVGCGECPDLQAYPPLPYDLSGALFRQKQRIFAAARLTVVAPSKWMLGIARNSPVVGACMAHHIPTGVDLETYRPIPKAAARQVLGLDPAARIVLFAANEIDGNPRKGGHLAIEALHRLGNADVSLVALLGIGGSAFAAAVPQPALRFGFVREERLLAAIYSAADLLLAPSTLENLPNSALEALACGCPVVATDVGGIAEAVVHMETGYLARAGSAEDLARGIAVALQDEPLRAGWSRQARARIERHFDARAEAQAFSSLYAELVAERRVRPPVAA